MQLPNYIEINTYLNTLMLAFGMKSCKTKEKHEKIHYSPYKCNHLEPD